MSNIINPYSASRAHLQQRPEPAATEPEDDSLPADVIRSDKASKSHSQLNSDEVNAKDSIDESGKMNGMQDIDEAAAGKFINTLEGAIERKEDVTLSPDQAPVSSTIPGLSLDEQQMIYRYFPESPSLALRLYKPDMSTNKVDPGSVGSRVDLRG